MNDKTIKKLMDSLYDKPLCINDSDLMVDRIAEITKLNNVVKYQPMGMYGLCGETGVGKTTALGFLKSDQKSYHIKITEKDSKEVIIGDLVYKLADQISIEKDKNLQKRANDIKDWVINERVESKGFSAGPSSIISANFTKTTSIEKKFNLYKAYDILKEMIDILMKKYGKIVLSIDELDKEKKEDTLLILDSVKNILVQKDLITIITLPFSIYREYSFDRLRWNESGNLENILKDMIVLNPLDDKAISEIIMKRLIAFPKLFDKGSINNIVRFSDGNPRDALWITQQIILNNLDRNNIDEKISIKTIKEIASDYIKYGKSFTLIQRDILETIAKNPGERQTIVDRLNGKIKKQTVYTYINRFISEGLLFEKNGVLRLPGKVYFAIVD